MDAAFDSIRKLALTANKVARQEIINQLRALANSFEDVSDTTDRFSHAPLETAAVRVGYDLDIFKQLVASEKPLSLDQIAAPTAADTVLLSRILRFLTAIGAVKEVAKDSFAANTVTRNLADEVAEAGIKHSFGSIAPQFHAMPAFLRRTGHKNPSDGLHTVFQDAWNTPLTPFAWFPSRPEELAYFNRYMALRRGPETSWLTIYPLKEQLDSGGWSDASRDRAVFVNVGGGIGHQCAEFKQAYPDVPGRVVLQDLQQSISEALPTPGVENMVHDFFEEQPVAGAKFYQMRGVLHNQTDSNGRRLLTRIKAAMAQDSILLVDELVLPEQGVDAYSAATDLTMMSAFASSERTEAQWRALFDSVGLSLTKTYTYNPVTHESVMDVRLA